MSTFDFNIEKRYLSGINLTVKLDVSWKSRSIRDQRGEAIRQAILSGSNLSGSNLSGSNLSGSNLSGSNLSDSNLSDSNLRGSNLSGSNLRGSDLSDSNLSDSNLRGSNLSGSNLSGSNLRGSNLSGSNLRGSNLRGSDLSGVPKIESIHKVVYEAVSNPGALDMSTWHTCETTHCRAGWVIQLAGAAGAAMEFCMGTPAAAALIYLKSDPRIGKIPNFYATNEDAMADMKRLAEAA